MSAAHAAVHLPLTPHPKWPQTNLIGISNWEIKVLPPSARRHCPRWGHPHKRCAQFAVSTWWRGKRVFQRRGGGTNVPGGNRNAGSPVGSTLATVATTSAQCEASESRLNANKLYSHTIYEIRYTVCGMRYTVYDILIWTSRNTEKKRVYLSFRVA